MKCEINLQRPLPESGHDVEAAWRVTNSKGTKFLVCDPCVQHYKRMSPGFNERGLRFTRLKKTEVPS